jgi:hypothetical protein
VASPPARPADVSAVVAEIVAAETELSQVGAALARRWCDLVAATIPVR